MKAHIVVKLQRPEREVMVWGLGKYTHELLCSSFLGLLVRDYNILPQKELYWVWVGSDPVDEDPCKEFGTIVDHCF